MGFAVAWLLTTAVPDVSGRTVAVPLFADPLLARARLAPPRPVIAGLPLAADPLLARARLVRPTPVARFAAPMAPPDLRPVPGALPTLTVAEPRQPSLTVGGRSEARGVESLAIVSARPNWRLTNRPFRSEVIAAGMAIRFVNIDGVLTPEIYLAGAGGKAATRIVMETMGRK